MERLVRNMGSLFAQLGQASEEDAISQFIETNGPLDGETLLHEAAFWSPMQANFLREAILDDAEWAEIVEALNSKLHAQH